MTANRSIDVTATASELRLRSGTTLDDLSVFVESRKLDVCRCVRVVELPSELLYDSISIVFMNESKLPEFLEFVRSRLLPKAVKQRHPPETCQDFS